MGRFSYSNKTEADGLEYIPTSFLKKQGYFLRSFQSGTMTWTRGNAENEHKSSVSITVSTFDEDNYLRIKYTQTDRDTGEKKDFDYKIPLATTPCQYGGKRYWFICPWFKNGVYCGRRVAKLYKNGDYFACRHCYELTYASSKENRRYKLFSLFNLITLESRIDKLREKIEHPYYRGKPTKKQQQLEKLYTQVGISYRKYTQLEKRGMV